MNFDPACEFLLDLLPANLFEARGGWSGVPLRHECKGCGETVPQSKQAAHQARHRRELSGQRERARRANLVKARKAKGRAVTA